MTIKENLLNKTTAAKLKTRVIKLTANTTPLWGKMTPAEMLLHCNSCNQQILTEQNNGLHTTLKQYLLKIIALYIAPRFTKGLKSEAIHCTQGMHNNIDFEKQKQLFLEHMDLFASNKSKLTLYHPAFGNINTKEWGIAAYKHMDHHLRQFKI